MLAPLPLSTIIKFNLSESEYEFAFHRRKVVEVSTEDVNIGFSRNNISRVVIEILGESGSHLPLLRSALIEADWRSSFPVTQTDQEKWISERRGSSQ
jgi:hypothetical protein